MVQDISHSKMAPESLGHIFDGNLDVTLTWLAETIIFSQDLEKISAPLNSKSITTGKNVSEKVCGELKLGKWLSCMIYWAYAFPSCSSNGFPPYDYVIPYEVRLLRISGGEQGVVLQIANTIVLLFFIKHSFYIICYL